MRPRSLALSPRAGQRWRRWSAIFCGFWLLALATHSSGLVNPVHCDFSTWLRVSRDWSAGLSLYGETFDNKNPTVFLLVRLIDSHHPAVSLYFAETLLSAVAASMLCLALRRTEPRCALWAPLFLVVWSGTSITFVHGQTTEAIVLWLDVIAVSCAVLSAKNGTYVPIVVAGLLSFLAFSLRIPCIVHVAAYWPLILWANRRHGTPKTMRLMAAFAGAFSLALLSLYAHGQIDGYWDRFLDVTRYNLGYGALDRIPLSDSLLASAKVIVRIGLENPVMVLLVILTFLVFAKHRSKSANGGRMWFAIGISWLAASLFGAFPGGRHYYHYYHVIWAPLCILAALGLSKLSRRRSTRNAARILITAVAICVILLGVLKNGQGAGKWLAQRREGTGRQRHIAKSVEYLEWLTKPQTPVAMYVWLDNAELYWRVTRSSGSYSIPHVLPDSRLENWSRTVIEKRVPVIVVDESFDGRKTGGKQFRRLKQLLGNEYVEIHRIESLRFYLRRGTPFARQRD